jgi:hypothetical protein
VTRLEVELGILGRTKGEDENLKTLAFFREIKNIPPRSKANKYIEDYVERDDEKIDYVNKLIQETKIKLNNDNQFCYSVCNTFF